MKLPWNQCLAALALLGLVACHNPDVDPTVGDDKGDEHSSKSGEDIDLALRRLASAQVQGVGRSGVPTFVRGTLGKIDSAVLNSSPQEGLQVSLDLIAPVFRLSPHDLTITSFNSDSLGFHHAYYAQTKNGLPVVGGELALHVSKDGVIYAVHGTAHDGVALTPVPSITAEEAALAAQGGSWDVSPPRVGPSRLVYLIAVDGTMRLSWEQEVAGTRSKDPLRDLVYVDAHVGQVIERRPLIHSARMRRVHDLAHSTGLPGSPTRYEGDAPVADEMVNMNYDRLGDTYNCYKALFGRDSFDGQGSALVSSVHYGVDYTNAFWNGTQMVYGDGDGKTLDNLAKSMDVTAHEVTHGVIQRTANLAYYGEPGGLNESMADVLGNVCEAFRDGGVSSNTWKVGEDVWTPGINGDALRYMSDPRKDGVSIDYYPDYSSGMDVHYSSGIGNLAFFLLSQGGTHPRGRSSIVVPAIAITKARQIWYRALTTYMTSGTDFLGARNATKQAAADLYTFAEADAVEKAWSGVGVPPPAPPPSNVITLSNGVAVPDLSGAVGDKQYFALEVPANERLVTFELEGGVGDADLYVKFGSAPTTSNYDCRSSRAGPSEVCRVANPLAGTWHAMTHAYSAYSGVGLRATYADPPENVSVLVNGVPVTNLSGAAGSKRYWKLTVPPGKPGVTFAISVEAGLSGDADLYVRRGVEPTLTAHDCGPHLEGSNETCTFTNPVAGNYFVMLHGYVSFSVVSLVGRYP